MEVGQTRDEFEWEAGSGSVQVGLPFRIVAMGSHWVLSRSDKIPSQELLCGKWRRGQEQSQGAQ